MKHLRLLALLLPLFSHAAVYKYKDANGNTIFTDQPPTGAKADPQKVKANTIDTSGGSFNTREAMRKNPVTLWANNCGDSCDSARALLGKRGIRYSLRNPQASEADFNALKKLAGEAIVPVLQIGNSVQKGFQQESWAAALDQAGYGATPDPTLKPEAVPAAKPASAPAAAKAPAPAPVKNNPW